MLIIVIFAIVIIISETRTTGRSFYRRTPNRTRRHTSVMASVSAPGRFRSTDSSNISSNRQRDTATHPPTMRSTQEFNKPMHFISNKIVHIDRPNQTLLRESLCLECKPKNLVDKNTSRVRLDKTVKGKPQTIWTTNSHNYTIIYVSCRKYDEAPI